jgi:hypothetical protein
MLRARALLDNIRRYWVLVFAAACLPLAILYLDDLYLQASGRLQFDAAWLLMAAITQFSVWLALALGWRETVTCCAHFRIGVRDAFAHLGLFTAGKYLPGKVWGALARGTRLGQAGSTLGGAAQATLVEQVLVFHSAAALCALIGAWVLDDAWRLPLAHSSCCWLACRSAASGSRRQGQSWYCSGHRWKPRRYLRFQHPHTCDCSRSTFLLGFCMD